MNPIPLLFQQLVTAFHSLYPRSSHHCHFQLISLPEWSSKEEMKQLKLLEAALKAADLVPLTSQFPLISLKVHLQLSSYHFSALTSSLQSSKKMHHANLTYS